MESPYEVLGLDRDAGEDAIERAYRRRVKEAHPDHGGSPAAFRRVRAAYEAVSDEVVAEESPVERSGVASETDAGAEPEPTEEVDPEDPLSRTYKVEYLDYDAVTDHDWDLRDADLFSRARDAGLVVPEYGHVTVEPEESLLEAAERAGFAWPFACRGGACANCAVAVLSGDMGLPVDHVLPDKMIDRGIRLSCVGAPITSDTQVVYNVKHMPALEELRLPPTPFERAHAGD